MYFCYQVQVSLKIWISISCTIQEIHISTNTYFGCTKKCSTQNFICYRGNIQRAWNVAGALPNQNKETSNRKRKYNL